VRVVWSPSALHEITDIYSYIARFNPHAAKRLVEALIIAGDSLGTFAYRGRLVGPHLRELTVVYPYIIRYRIIGDEVRVLRVRHGMREI
jgi:toxin ParE1/3/4